MPSPIHKSFPSKAAITFTQKRGIADFNKFKSALLRSLNSKLNLDNSPWVNISNKFPKESAQTILKDWAKKVKKLEDLSYCEFAEKYSAQYSSNLGKNDRELIESIIYQEVIMPSTPLMLKIIDKHLDKHEDEEASILSTWILNTTFDYLFKEENHKPHLTSFLEISLKQRFKHIEYRNRRGCCNRTCSTCGNHGKVLVYKGNPNFLSKFQINPMTQRRIIV